MNIKDVQYIDPTTSQYLNVDVSDIKVKNTSEHPWNHPSQIEAFLYYAASISGRSPSSIKSQMNTDGGLYNILYGGPFVPHGRLRGLETTLSADADALDVALNIRNSTYEAYWTGVTGNILVASRKYLLMHRRPEPGESIWETGVGECDAEIITVDAGYVSGTNPTISAVATDRKKGAIVQEILGTPGSFMTGGDYGYLYELERPDAPTISTPADGTAQTIDISWTHSSQAADSSHSLSSGVSGPGAVTHYVAFVVKDGDTYSTYGPPDYLPERAWVSEYDDGGQSDAIYPINFSGALSSTTFSVTGLNRYWKPSTNESAAIVAGNYWVGIACLNQATFDPTLRMSKITWSTDYVTVA